MANNRHKKWCKICILSIHITHLKAVKKDTWYINNTVNYDLLYPKLYTFDLISSDADFAGGNSDRKSTSGTCHFLDIH